MKILIYGAGVIGSLYAVLFGNAGLDVTVYARGKRLQELTEGGLLYSDKGEVRSAHANIIGVLDDQDIYDFILLAVREHQLHAALVELKNNQSRTIVTMVNSLEAYSSWEKICGRGRILPAFPGAGGSIDDGILRASLTPGIIQKTTFGEIHGEKTKRSDEFAHILKAAKIPYQIVPDMHTWQLCHLAMVVPLADAYYETHDPGHAWKDTVLMLRTAKRIRRNFRALVSMGLELSPTKMNLFRILPASLVSTGLKITYRSGFGDRFMHQHSIKAPDEMKQLHDQFYQYLRENKGRVSNRSGST